MSKNWFVQGLITNMISWLITVVGGVITAILIRRGSAWGTPLLGGLAAFAFIGLGLMALKQLGRLSEQRTNLRNVESHVRLWLDKFRVAVKNDPNEETYFRFIVTTPNNTKIIVGRPRNEFSSYLVLRAELTASEDEKKRINALPNDKAEELILAIRLEMARLGVGYSGLGLPYSTLALTKAIPIGDNLTERH